MTKEAKNPEFAAWITKHALTKGIVVKRVKLCTGTRVQDRIQVVDTPYAEFYHRLDWHRTREAAIQRAEEMRTVRRKSLEKQLAKLDALSFL